MRRRLATLSVLAAPLFATGCVTPVGYGHGARYDRGWYDGGWTDAGWTGGRYAPGRTVVVRRAPVVVRRPVVRYVAPRRPAWREWRHRDRNPRRERYERHERRDRHDRRDRSRWRGADWRRHR